MTTNSTANNNGRKLDIAVIESRWWTEGNHSVRGTFDLLAGIHTNNPFNYHYEMFNNEESLKEIIPRLADRTDIRYLYIAAHGDSDAIYGPAEKRISRTIIKNILSEVHGRKLHGIYFGSCLFGHQTEGLLRNSGATWIAGFTEEIDWLDSTALDLYFWNAFYKSSACDQALKEDRAEALLKLLFALWIRIQYVFVEMGLCVSLHYKSKYVTFPDDVIDLDSEDGVVEEYRVLYNRVARWMEKRLNRGQLGEWP